MPNHVTTKIIFDGEHATKVLAKFAPGGKVDFNTLVPTPANVYQGDLGSSEETDFPLNWNAWNRENWGTKWNAYDTKIGREGERAFIQFNTAWSYPFPVICAFANTFQIPFETCYFDEGHNFWGTEAWRLKDGGGKIAYRATARASAEEDRRRLCIELKGYDPDAPEEPEGEGQASA